MNAAISRNQRMISQSGQLKSLNEASKSLGVKKNLALRTPGGAIM